MVPSHYLQSNYILRLGLYSKLYSVLYIFFLLVDIIDFNLEVKCGESVNEKKVQSPCLRWVIFFSMRNCVGRGACNMVIFLWCRSWCHASFLICRFSFKMIWFSLFRNYIQYIYGNVFRYTGMHLKRNLQYKVKQEEIQ